MTSRLVQSGFSILTLLALGGALAICASACGSKASPILPATGPLVLEVASAVVSDQRARLVFTAKGVPEGYRVYRKRWPAGSEPDPTRAETLLMVEIEQNKPAGPVTQEYTDTRLNAEDIYEYHLMAFSVSSDGVRRYGRATVIGPFSTNPPGRFVQNLQAEAQGEVVRLYWRLPKAGDGPDPDERLIVYRSEGETGLGKPSTVTALDTDESTWTDTGAAAGLQYQYTLRLAREENGMRIEGAAAEPASLRMFDETPPPAPVITDIQAIAGGVRIRWQLVDDAGLMGYVVQRRVAQTQGDPFVECGNMVTVDEFTDRGLSAAGAQHYRVMAVDRAGNRTASKEARVEVTDENLSLNDIEERTPEQQLAAEPDRDGPEKTNP